MIASMLLAAALTISALPIPAPSQAPSAAPVTIPFRLEENHLIIDVAVNGHPTRALFDTGASNVVSPEFAKELGLRATGNSRAGGVGEGTVAVQRTHADEMTFGPIAMRDQNFTILPLPSALTHGDDPPVEMLVGAEILNKYVTRIDYAARTLTFTPAGQFAYQGNGAAIPIEFGGGTTPRVRGSIDGIPGLLQIDTGSSASLTLTSAFVDDHDLRKKYRSAGNTVMGRGVGGYTRGDLARAKTVFIGPVQVDDPVVELSTDKRGAFASTRYAANVGTDVLRRFTLTFDYSRKTMFAEPNAANSSPPPYNRSGMYAQNDDRRFFDVVAVLPNGPAASAGVQAGDHITAIDGKPAESMSANEFWMLLRGPVGDRHALTVDRGGTTTNLTLTLREVV